MSNVIIIGGTVRARSAIDQANTDAGAKPWTQAQKDAMAAKFATFADDVEKTTNAYNAS